MKIRESDIENILSLAREASEKIMDVYSSSRIEFTRKKDSSPLTLADKASHTVLLKGLRELFPSVPVFSEEGGRIPYAERKDWEYFWLVDPLDGTKEFISKNGEFTVNIALVEKDKPVFGLVAVPASGTAYYALRGSGAYKKKGDRDPEKIRVREDTGGETVVARSRSHSSEIGDKIISALGGARSLYAGSALKFCLVAEGRADIYIRSGPTMEWDTAAGHCLIEEAGGVLRTLENTPLVYNKRNPVNPGFVSAGSSRARSLELILKELFP